MEVSLVHQSHESGGVDSWKSCSLLEAHLGRLARQRGALRHADVLRVGAEPPRVDTEDLVTSRELGDGRAGYFDLASQLGAQDLPPRPGKPLMNWLKNGSPLLGPAARSRDDLAGEGGEAGQRAEFVWVSSPSRQGSWE